MNSLCPTSQSDLTRAATRGRSPFSLRNDLLERQGEVAPAPERATSPQRHPEVARGCVDLRATYKPGATSHSDYLRSLPAPRATSRSDVPRSLHVVYLVELMIYQGLFGHFVMHVLHFLNLCLSTFYCGMADGKEEPTILFEDEAYSAQDLHHPRIAENWRGPRDLQ
uniref:Uncharacterized protein n=1 Tax=Brassica oleracea var. oleracea TaxID=109376 RepID=A0A0D3E9F5_BRAOL